MKVGLARQIKAATCTYYSECFSKSCYDLKQWCQSCYST